MKISFDVTLCFIVFQSLIKKMGEEKLQELINYALGYLANLKLPAKR